MKIFPIIAFLFLLTLNSFAGQFNNLNIIGFSKDGKYMAFEEYGTQDGSGFPYAFYTFINVEKNTVVDSKGLVIEKEASSEEAARARAKRMATPLMRRLRVIPGNTGTLLVERLLTDRAARELTGNDKTKAQRINFAKYVDSAYSDGDYDLILNSIEDNSKKDCENLGPNFRFELSLTDNKTGETKFLQKDASIPKSRGCPLYYGLRSVYMYGDNILVFVESYTMGFEGPDMQFLAVTGNITTPSN